MRKQNIQINCDFSSNFARFQIYTPNGGFTQTIQLITYSFRRNVLKRLSQFFSLIILTPKKTRVNCQISNLTVFRRTLWIRTTLKIGLKVTPEWVFQNWAFSTSSGLPNSLDIFFQSIGHKVLLYPMPSIALGLPETKYSKYFILTLSSTAVPRTVDIKWPDHSDHFCVSPESLLRIKSSSFKHIAGNDVNRLTWKVAEWIGFVDGMTVLSRS